MDTDAKAFELFWQIYHTNADFRTLLEEHLSTGKVRFFDQNEWDKIKSQNFISPTPEAVEFLDMFSLGYNIGDCVGTSRQLSYSYNDVDIVSGVLPILKGTRNAEKEGGHCWLETPKTIIDSSLMLVIDRSLKSAFGYIEEQRLTSFQLASFSQYQARKEFVNDSSIQCERRSVDETGRSSQKN